MQAAQKGEEEEEEEEEEEVVVVTHYAGKRSTLSAVAATKRSLWPFVRPSISDCVGCRPAELSPSCRKQCKPSTKYRW
jgi:hypothetical protein